MIIANVQASPQDSRDYVYDYDRSAVLPASVDLREYAGDVEYQGRTGSCVANAAVSALEILLARQGKFENLSRLFEYWNLREGYQELSGKDGGSYPRDAFKVADKIGICDEKIWAFDDSKVNVRPTDEAFADAAQTKAFGYYSIPMNDSTLFAIKHAVAKGYPVLFAANINAEFQRIRATSVALTKPQFSNASVPIGAHAMLVVGYKGDDLLIENSWGTQWGCAGYALIDGSALLKDTFEAWVCTGINGERLPELKETKPLNDSGAVTPKPTESNEALKIIIIIIIIGLLYLNVVP